MAILTAIGGAAAAWAVPKILKTISNWWTGKGKKGRERRDRRRPTVSKTGRITTTELPGGDIIHEIDKENPGFAKAVEANKKEILEAVRKSPEKWPGIQDFIGQAQDIFGDLPGYRRTVVPEIPPEAELKPFDIGPIAAQAMQRFKGEILPGLAERFTALTGGGQRSGAFARQTTRAGERLTGALAELKSREERADALERARLGMQRGQLGLQRAGLLQQQEGEAARLGLLGRGQRMAEVGTLADIYERGRQPEREWLDRRIRAALGMPAARDIYTQPAQAQQPGFLQGFAPAAAKAAGKAVGTYAPDIYKWAKEGISSYFA